MPYGFHAIVVPEYSLFAVSFGPSPVAIHNDGYMLGYIRQVNLIEKAHCAGLRGVT